jgi:site-specific recombinase XerD
MEQIFRRETVRARILENPLGRILQQYIDYLKGRGYGPSSLHQYVFVVEHFGNWLGAGSISHESVDRFVGRHILTCRCKKPAPCTSHCVRAALNRLLEMRGLSRPDAVVPAVVSRLLREYKTHLLVVAGLAESTAYYRLRHARDLLENFAVQRASELRGWGPSELADYVARTGRRWKPGGGQQLASSVRSFLRFLLFKGLVRRDLAVAIPSFANWRLSSLPAVVERTKLEKLLAGVDSSTPIGMRDRGALLCMIDLGLRASDVVAITADGVDLPGNVLRLSHAKERRVTELPMTKRLALALRRYLREGRPPSASGLLFVIHRAPIGQPLKPIGIRGIVVRYAARAGMADVIRGTHIIRHSVASSLINAGASIKDIADLLGHRSIDTTAIYAKVNVRSLAAVAMPWPGARQ